jgi:hypothetical protein
MRYKVLKYPTPFGLVKDNTKFAFHNHDNPLGYKKDGKCFVNGVEYNLGNSEYLCYPIGFTKAQKRSFGRHLDTSKLEKRNRRRKKKGERMRDNYRENRRYRHCDWCGGQMQWCDCCQMYSNICCVDYGTCWCS